MGPVGKEFNGGRREKLEPLGGPVVPPRFVVGSGGSGCKGCNGCNGCREGKGCMGRGFVDTSLSHSKRGNRQKKGSQIRGRKVRLNDFS